MQLDFLFPFFLSFVWFVLWTMDPQRNPGIRRFGSYVNEYFSCLSVIDVPAEFPRVIRERKGRWVPISLVWHLGAGCGYTKRVTKSFGSEKQRAEDK